MSKVESRKRKQTSRREFLESTGAALVVAAAAPPLDAQTDSSPQSAASAEATRTAIRVIVNGAEQRILTRRQERLSVGLVHAAALCPVRRQHAGPRGAQ